MRRFNRAVAKPEPSPKHPAKTAEPSRVLHIPARSGTVRPRDFKVLGQATRTPPAGSVS